MNNRITKSDVLWGGVIVVAMLMMAAPVYAIGFVQ